MEKSVQSDQTTLFVGLQTTSTWDRPNRSTG